MSWRLTEQVAELRGLRPLPRIVLLHLANFCNDEGENAFPDMATLVRKTSCSRRAVEPDGHRGELTADLVRRK